MADDDRDTIRRDPGAAVDGTAPEPVTGRRTHESQPVGRGSGGSDRLTGHGCGPRIVGLQRIGLQRTGRADRTDDDVAHLRAH